MARYTDDDSDEAAIRDGWGDYVKSRETTVDFTAGDGENSIDVAIRELKRFGVDVEAGEGYLSVEPEAGNLLILDAVNRAAKVFDPRFYELKALVFADAALEGKDAGVYVFQRDDEAGKSVMSLYHESVGVVSIHDPHDKVYDKIVLTPAKWITPVPFHEVERVPSAFKTLESSERVRELARLTAIAEGHVETASLEGDAGMRDSASDLPPKSQAAHQIILRKPPAEHYRTDVTTGRDAATKTPQR